MVKRKKSKTIEPQPFHKRFSIEIDVEEAQRRFVNRIKNQIFNAFFLFNDELKEKKWWYVRNVANKFGEEWLGSFQDFDSFIGNDFLKCLQCLETIYPYLVEVDQSKKKFSLSWEYSKWINMVVDESEVDLGVTWKDGRFYPSGAKELDEALVNQPLEWLQAIGYHSVLTPFSKALEHYLNSKKKPELLADVITDLYESIEALAKIVTGKTKRDLSANRESFLKEIKASEAYKSILKEYINYANEFRHAAEEGMPKLAPSRRETESFLYLTGLFIRMAMS